MSVIVWAATLVAVYFVWLGLQQKSRRLALPPGPKGLPVIGNLRDMTLTGLWFEARKWAKQYGQFHFLRHVRHRARLLTVFSAHRRTGIPEYIRPRHTVCKYT